MMVLAALQLCAQMRCVLTLDAACTPTVGATLRHCHPSVLQAASSLAAAAIALGILRPARALLRK